MVTLTIDGVQVSVERGASILDAAQKAGIRIPTLCHDKRLIPFGSCRLCVVEVTQRGRTRVMPACFNHARDGMEVATHTEQLADLRRLQLQLLLRSHPLLCPSCDAAGDCRLQDLVHEYGVGDLPFSRESRYFHVDNDSHFIRHNMNLCVRCGMCVRVCDEVQGQQELSFINRGMLSEISTDFARPLDCEFCGQCANICPVGAIRSKWLVGTGRDFELTRADSVCAFCSLGCNLNLGHKDNKTVYVTSPTESPNEGNLCVKGRYGWPYIHSDARLDKPAVKTEAGLQHVEWDDALNRVAERLTRIKTEHGAQSIAVLGSGRLTNEEAYVLNRFTRSVIGTPHIDHSAGLTYQPLTDAFMPALGYPAGTNAIRELRHADVILLVGADLTETHPVAKNEIILATGREHAKVFVLDPVRTRLTERRESAFLCVKPGAEYVALNGMIRILLDDDLADKAAASLPGFDELKASLSEYSAETVAEITGLTVGELKEAALAFGQAKKAAIVLTQSMNKLGPEVETARAAVNLALVAGKIGKEFCGVHALGERANSQGAIDMGLTPALLPGFRDISDPAARAQIEAVWGSVPAEAGAGAEGILRKAAAGEIKALYILGENPLETYPNRALVETALSNLEYLVVQDLFATATAAKADVVLPVVSFAEKMGTFTSAERLVQLLKPVYGRFAGKPDLEILVELARKMGAANFDYTGPEQVFDEIASLVAPYKGISYGRLQEKGVNWPCPDENDPGRPILYEGGFPAGKAKLFPAAKPSAVKGERPMFLIPSVVKFHSGSFSSWSPSLMEVCPEAIAEMNSLDMAALGVAEGDSVRISGSAGSSIVVKATASYRAMAGSIIVPYHFGSVRLNSLTDWGNGPLTVKVEKSA